MVRAYTVGTCQNRGCGHLHTKEVYENSAPSGKHPTLPAMDVIIFHPLAVEICTWSICWHPTSSIRSLVPEIYWNFYYNNPSCEAYVSYVRRCQYTYPQDVQIATRKHSKITKTKAAQIVGAQPLAPSSPETGWQRRSRNFPPTSRRDKGTSTTAPPLLLRNQPESEHGSTSVRCSTETRPGRLRSSLSWPPPLA